MRKISVLLIVCLVFMSLHNVVLAENTYTDTLRIGISYGSSGKSDGWFLSENPIDILDAYYLSYITTIPANTKFKITAYSGALTSDYFSPTGSAIRLDSISPITYGSSEYRGSFELRCSNDKLTVINVVNTEDYIASVLGKEMSTSWPLEALKAQAVCARNYAIANLNKHSSYGFDLCTTVDCQVYAGTSSEAESTRRAVQETKGNLVKYQGRVVSLYYFSCDGGYTESSENVWTSAEGYLRGKKDIYENPDYATQYNWSKTFTKKQLEDILAAKKLNVGQLLDVRIDEVSENNSVMKLTFVGTDGEKSITKSKTREYLSLNSQYYTIQKNTNETVNAPDNSISKHVLTNTGVVSVTNPSFALTSEGVIRIPYEIETPETSEVVPYDSYIFYGHGWGHRIGMSQWSAYSMAKLGFNYKDILKFYYTDITIDENGYNG